MKSSTQVKEEHLWDVAIQAHVEEGAGLLLRRLCLLHINKEYEYPGGKHDPRKLFTLTDVTEDVTPLLPQVPELLATMRKPLWLKSLPEVAIGDQCHAPFECPFIDYCHPPGPEHLVSELYRASQKLRQRIAGDGIAGIPDIPDCRHSRRTSVTL